MKRAFLVWFWVVLLWAGGAGAQQVSDASRAAARSLGYAGIESYQAGDYAAAFIKLDKAYQVLQAPSLGLWSARALIKTNKWVEATERLRQVAALKPQAGDLGVQEQARRDAQLQLDELLPRLPSLVIELKGASPDDARVSVDGEAVSPALISTPLPADPGRHVVRGTVDGREVTESVVLSEGAHEKVVLRFSPTPTLPAKSVAPATVVRPASPLAADVKPSSVRSVVGWALIAVGGAGVAVGATTGIIAISKKSDLEASELCRSRLCLPAEQDRVDSYHSLRTLSGIGIYAGAALAATGLVLVITAPRYSTQRASAGTPSWFVSLSPRGGALAGQF
jgi:hypothetical protein